MDMDDSIVTAVVDLYKEKRWRDIAEQFHDHPQRNKLLWVFPSEENFRFLEQCLREHRCDRVLSVGCGTGLLEWMLSEATRFPVTGVEVDGAWWHCKYAPPTFIPLLLTTTQLDKDVFTALQNPTTALLFCYFNNRPAFEEYLEQFKGSMLIIIGPGEGKHVHTAPAPFDDISSDWELRKWQEVRNSRDFIAIYCKISH